MNGVRGVRGVWGVRGVRGVGVSALYTRAPVTPGMINSQMRNILPHDC